MFHYIPDHVRHSSFKHHARFHLGSLVSEQIHFFMGVNSFFTRDKTELWYVDLPYRRSELETTRWLIVEDSE